MINAYIAWGLTTLKTVKLGWIRISYAFVFDMKSTMQPIDLCLWNSYTLNLKCSLNNKIIIHTASVVYVLCYKIVFMFAQYILTKKHATLDAAY